MLMTANTYKLMAIQLSELSNNIDSAIGQRAKNLVAIKDDKTRSDLWKTEELSVLEKNYQERVSALLAQVRLIQGKVVAFELRSRDPLMALFDHRIEGTLTRESDAAAKGEFRALMATQNSEVRRAWFNALADAKDWARLGVLIALDPKLSEAARALDIPGRDDSLDWTARLRKQADDAFRMEVERVGEERMIALNLKSDNGGLNQVEAIELLTLADRKAKGWPVDNANLVQDDVPKPLTSEERIRYAELSGKDDLTKSEGVELIALASRVPAE